MSNGNELCWVLTGSGTLTSDGRVTGIGRTGVAGRRLKPGEQVEVVSFDLYAGAVKALERIRDHANSAEDAAVLAQNELDRIKGTRHE